MKANQYKKTLFLGADITKAGFVRNCRKMMAEALSAQQKHNTYWCKLYNLRSIP